MTEPATLLFADPANAPVWATYALILVAAVLPTAIWRWAGVALAGRVGENSELLVWVRAVATALVAAVVAKLILSDTGAIAVVPLWLRLVAAGAGFAVFLATGRRVIVGVVVAEAVLVAGQYLVAAVA